MQKSLTTEDTEENGVSSVSSVVIFAALVSALLFLTASVIPCTRLDLVILLALNLQLAV
jgi:hypothetical protein